VKTPRKAQQANPQKPSETFARFISRNSAPKWTTAGTDYRIKAKVTFDLKRE
jgi:hypothetical protein